MQAGFSSILLTQARVSLVSLIGFVVVGSWAWSACCATRSDGPTGWAPEYAACPKGGSTANYGGTGTFTTDGNYLVGGPINWTAELKRGDFIQTVASKTGQSFPACNATTQVAIWTPTTGCVCSSGIPYYSKVSFTYIGLCNINSTLTVSASSSSIVCP